WALFPAGTFAVNLIGCAAIGLIAGWLGVGGPEAAEAAPHALWRPLLVAGVLGGFTTFSAFGLETLLLVRAGLFLPAAIYVVGSVGVGLMLSAGGYALTARR
ncbi:MAG: CrcB family protein, partial [Phycisphaerales bacterium]|nr:CrcB family protein [Phycisphaerales bacterium]